MFNPAFQTLTETYARPFFFYAQDSYENVTELDLGKEKLILERKHFQDKRKNLNDVFDSTPESHSHIQQDSRSNQVKSGLSIKERLDKKLNK